MLDSHTFYSCRAHNPLTTLYCSLSAAQASFDAPLSDEMLTMLLCQWAVTPYRSGEHRPLVVAMLLRQRQEDILKVRDCVIYLKPRPLPPPTSCLRVMIGERTLTRMHLTTAGRGRSYRCQVRYWTFHSHSKLPSSSSWTSGHLYLVRELVLL